MQTSPIYELLLFSFLSKAHIVDTECLEGIYPPIFIVEHFSGLCAHPFICLINDLMAA